MKYALKKVRCIRLYDIATKEHKVTLNDLKSFKLTGSNETEYAEGAEGARLAAFDLKKVSGIEATNGAIDTGMIALQTGGDEVVVNGGTGVKLREEIKITDGIVAAKKFSLSHKASGSAGCEIGYIYKADRLGNPEKSIRQVLKTPIQTGECSYSNKEVTFFEGDLNAGDIVIVDYCPQFKSYKEIVNDSNRFTFPCEVYVDAWFTDLCDETDTPLQLWLPKGKVSGEMDYSFGDQAAVQSLKVDALSQPCSSNGNTLWKLFDYDMNEIDDGEGGSNG